MKDLQIVVEQAEPRFLAIRNDSAAFAREAGFAIQLLNANSFIAETARKDTGALVAAVSNLAAVGLSLNPLLKQCYLVPRKIKGGVTKVCLDIGAPGWVFLARQSGLKDLWFDLVRVGDEFALPQYGDRVTHKYDPFGVRGDVRGAYCQHVYNDGTIGQCVTLSLAEIEKRRACSEAWIAHHVSKKASQCPWCEWPDDMMLKTVLRYARRWWPSTPELDTALHVTAQEFAGADHDRADDAPPAEGGALCLSPEQVSAIKKRAHDVGLPYQTICDRYQVARLDFVEASEFGAIMARIADFESKVEARKAATKTAKQEAA